MKRFNLAVATFLLAASVAGTADATIYTYTGNVFTTQTVDGVPVPATGRVRAVYSPDENIDSDGNQWTITGLGGFEYASTVSNSEDIFLVNFDGLGNVTSWDIQLFLDVGNSFLFSINSSDISGDVAGYSFATNQPCFEDCIFSSLGGNVRAPGRWSPTFGGDVPEPASWAMLIAGFGLTGAALRRRRTAVAA